MKAKVKKDVSIEYMEYPSLKYPAPEWFKNALKSGQVYSLAKYYYVHTEVGTVSFPPKGFVLVRQHSGELFVMNRDEFLRLFEDVLE